MCSGTQLLRWLLRNTPLPGGLSWTISTEPSRLKSGAYVPHANQHCKTFLKPPEKIIGAAKEDIGVLSVDEAQQKLKDLKAAVDIEKKRRYINVQGRKQTFADFTASSIQMLNQMSLGDEKQLSELQQRFKQYAFMDLGARMTMMESLETALQEFHLGFEVTHKTVTKGAGKAEQKALNEIEVQFIKGVGPKRAQLMESVGIRTVEDLLYYFPRQYLDYQQQARMNSLTEGDEVTVVGTVHSVAAYQAKRRNMSIVTLTLTDGTGVARSAGSLVVGGVAGRSWNPLRRGTQRAPRSWCLAV